MKQDIKLKIKYAFIEDKFKGKELLTTYLLEKYYFKTILGTKVDVIYVYNNGIYSPIGKEIIQEEVENILKEKSTTPHINEVINKIKRKTKVAREDLEQKDKNLICLNNGIYDLRSEKLLEHNPKYFFLNKIPVNYNSESYLYNNFEKSNLFKFFRETIGGEELDPLFEFLGYCLYPDFHIKKAFILLGERDTGKTTFLRLLTSLVGLENVSSLSLQRIAHDRFATAQLHGKLVNICDDLEKKDIEDTGAFKMATGGGYISAQFKFGDEFNFKNTSKLIFAANKIPRVKDTDDDAYYNRWIILCFNNVFDENNSERDLNLIDKITSPKELECLLIIALDGLKNLLKNGKFTYWRTSDEIKTMMQKSDSSIASFIEDKVRIPDIADKKDPPWIIKEDLYRSYRTYCMDLNLPLASKQKFGRDLKKYVPRVVSGRKNTSDKESCTVWFNLECL